MSKSDITQILQNEYFGLNPTVPYDIDEALHRRGKFLGFLSDVGISLLILLSGGFAGHFFSDYRDKANHFSTTRNWDHTRLFSISGLKKLKGSSELEDYLRDNAGHVRIAGIPSPHKIVAPEGARFTTGGLFSRTVELNLSFYAEDEEGSRAYFGLTPELGDSWLHVLSAGDHRETVRLGVQLDRNFDLARNNYAVKQIYFPSEQVSFGVPTYRVVERAKLEELTTRIKAPEKDRIFRAVVELGYVY